MEQISSKLNTVWYENAMAENQKLQSLDEAIEPKYSPKDNDDGWEMHLDIGRIFTEDAWKEGLLMSNINC